MDEDNMNAHDFYILPRMTLAEGVLRLADHNGLSFDAFRFDTLDGFFALAERAPLPRAASAVTLPAPRVAMIPIDRITDVNPPAPNNKGYRGFTPKTPQTH